MITYYKKNGKKVAKQEYNETNCWVDCVCPDISEVKYISKELNIDYDFLKSAIDEEETPHIDVEDDVTLIVLDTPVKENTDKNSSYYTTPISIFITKSNILTISLKNNDISNILNSKFIKNADINNKLNFVLNVMLFVSRKYLKYINQITKTGDMIENVLQKSMKNKELMQLLEIKKSLVYFSSSLKNIKITLEKMTRSNFVKVHGEDRELLDDVLIEIKQAIEMTDTYFNIISSTMEAFASIISNNLNIVMKILASLTLIISIPTVVSGLYGMNTPNLPMMQHWWFPLVISGVLMYFSYLILKYKDMI
ncbi:MAG: magnesium transporter CorA family protein [Candidatus Improbicoccus devescovinae]|nr:MAG: magnesium transporter CorA family protein [Candidatus Improbicoccus devescovinae]